MKNRGFSPISYYFTFPLVIGVSKLGNTGNTRNDKASLLYDMTKKEMTKQMTKKEMTKKERKKESKKERKKERNDKANNPGNTRNDKASLLYV